MSDSTELAKMVDAKAPSIDHLPVVDDDYVRGVYDALIGMDVALDPNPLEYGPKELNKKIHQTRKYLSDCERMFLQVSSWIHLFKLEHTRQEAQFNLLRDVLLANDTTVRSGVSIQDRLATVQVRLRDRAVQLTELSLVLQSLDAVLAVIKSKRMDLKDIQGRVKDQIKLCQESLTLGGRWGSAIPSGATVPTGSKVPDGVLMGVVEVESDELDLSRPLESRQVQEQPVEDLSSVFGAADLPDEPAPKTVGDSGVVVDAPQPITEDQVDSSDVALVGSSQKEPAKDQVVHDSDITDVDQFLSELEQQEDFSKGVVKALSTPTEIDLDDLLG